MIRKPFAITLDPGSSLANHTGSWRTMRPEYVDRLPPCNHACPAGENVQRWDDLEPGSYSVCFEHRTMADIQAINPEGRVPALADGPHVISQSLAICEYLEETHPEPTLLPNSDYFFKNAGITERYTYQDPPQHYTLSDSGWERVKDYDTTTLGVSVHYFKTSDNSSRLVGREYRTETRDAAGNWSATSTPLSVRTSSAAKAAEIDSRSAQSRRRGMPFT